MKAVTAITGVVLVMFAAVLAWVIYNYFKESSRRFDFKWIDWQLDEGIPPGGVLVGMWRDDSVMYLGRAKILDDLRPAKFFPSTKRMYVTWNGREYRVRDVQVIVGAGLSWANASQGRVPCNAVDTGFTADGERIYTGRAFVDGFPLPGAIIPSRLQIYVGFGGLEYAYDEYQVLVSEQIKC